MLTLYRGTAEELTALVATVTDPDLVRPTPCDGWDVRRLLAHQLGEQDGFARALTTGVAAPADFERESVEGGELAGEWGRSSAELLAAFENTPQEQIVQLGAYGPLPASVVLRMQLLDAAVHAWDLASALGGVHRPANAVVADVLRFARAIAVRPEPSAAFAAPVDPGVAADDWVAALRLLGRSCGDDGRWQRS